MRVLFDVNVLIAVLDSAHVHHVWLTNGGPQPVPPDGPHFH